jgi:protein gp37
MAENTKIEWAHHTFNPWVGCTKVSPGCDHCYAEGWANRTGQSVLWAGQRRRTSGPNWAKLIKWDREAKAAGERHRVFCASLADVFDNQVPERWRHDLWHYIALTPNLDWLLLTKRPQNIEKMLPDARTGVKPWGQGWPNVWLGTTVENQAEADRRIPHLLAVPAAVRFLSCEPLLGPVDLTKIDCTSVDPDSRGITLNGLTGGRKSSSPWHINWVICGGESGPKARPMHPDWARSLRDQCLAADVAFHFKQWGEWSPHTREIEDFDGTISTTPKGHPGWRAHVPGGIDGMFRVGKARAGRLLDGREWNDFPSLWDRLCGAAPDATGNQTSEAFVRSQREEWSK